MNPFAEVRSLVERELQEYLSFCAEDDAVPTARAFIAHLQEEVDFIEGNVRDAG